MPPRKNLFPHPHQAEELIEKLVVFFTQPDVPWIVAVYPKSSQDSIEDILSGLSAQGGVTGKTGVFFLTNPDTCFGNPNVQHLASSRSPSSKRLAEICWSYFTAPKAHSDSRPGFDQA